MAGLIPLKAGHLSVPSLEPRGWKIPLYQPARHWSGGEECSEGHEGLLWRTPTEDFGGAKRQGVLFTLTLEEL
ncbi:MAG: hypothetical protein IIB94_11595 [Candidatus Marinimicrobia bacterium]|nr:hypothetical protein [Candidatus Neomarinimicrobiota bacterium]